MTDAAVAVAAAPAVVVGSVGRERTGRQPFWERVCLGAKQHFPWVLAPWIVLRGQVLRVGD